MIKNQSKLAEFLGEDLFGFGTNPLDELGLVGVLLFGELPNAQLVCLEFFFSEGVHHVDFAGIVGVNCHKRAIVKDLSREVLRFLMQFDFEGPWRKHEERRRSFVLDIEGSSVHPPFYVRKVFEVFEKSSVRRP